MKIVLNKCYGGFGVSNALIKRAREEGVAWAQYPKCVLKGETFPNSKVIQDSSYNSHSLHHVYRYDPDLVRLVEEMGDEANGECAQLEVVDGPDYNDLLNIHDYDGMESLSYGYCHEY